MGRASKGRVYGGTCFLGTDRRRAMDSGSKEVIKTGGDTESSKRGGPTPDGDIKTVSDASRVPFDPRSVEPGLAALVVRQYLLPMFEGKMGFEAPPDPAVEAEARSRPEQVEASVAGGPEDGIFGELKLSDQLLDELQRTKKDANELKRKHQSSEGIRKRLDMHIAKLVKDIEDHTLKLEATRVSEQEVRQETLTLESEIRLLNYQQWELQTESKKLQKENARLAARLSGEEGKVERLSHVVSQNQNTSSLSQLESDVLRAQVQNLHSRVAGLFGTTKNMLDERAFNLAKHEISSMRVNLYSEKIWVELDRLTDERQKLEVDQKELQESKSKLEDSRLRMSREHEDQRMKSLDNLSRMFEEKEVNRKDRDKLSKKLKEMTEDRDKLKQRMKKYRLRRMFDHDTSMCRNCGKDFMKTENFNWSCRTHTSEFGGEMYWCCGKLGKDALGCKFSKHESKDDDDDLDDKERKEKDEADLRIKNANVSCYGCKDIGHMAKNCIRDPNMRTKFNALTELNRITQVYNADASKKQLRENHGRAIAKMINEKIGFAVMADDIPDDERNPFQDLIDLSREKVKQRRLKSDMDGKADGKSGADGEIIPLDDDQIECFEWGSEASGGSTSDSEDSDESSSDDDSAEKSISGTTFDAGDPRAVVSALFKRSSLIKITDK